MGHLGLTPQSVKSLGGYRVQGRSLSQVETLVDDARALEDAGIFSLVLEGVPASVGALLTRSTAVPTIGIGAGLLCDGQVLVVHDLLGFGETAPARFVRRYADVRGIIVEAARAFAEVFYSGAATTE